MRKQIGIKSRRLYEICSYTGLAHYISLVWREYASGRSIYILKVKIFSLHGKAVKKYVYHDFNAALQALREKVEFFTLYGIDLQLDLPI